MGEKCGINDCFKKCCIANVGFCNYCKVDFCRFHRLPEEHLCKKMETIQKESKLKLEKKLLSTKIGGVESKITKI